MNPSGRVGRPPKPRQGAGPAPPEASHRCQKSNQIMDEGQVGCRSSLNIDAAELPSISKLTRRWTGGGGWGGPRCLPRDKTPPAQVQSRDTGKLVLIDTVNVQVHSNIAYNCGRANCKKEVVMFDTGSVQFMTFGQQRKRYLRSSTKASSVQH